jgi:primosomal protein N' (replication factor Y)
MAGIILSGAEIEPLFAYGNALAQHDGPLRRIGAQLYGPAPAPIARIRGRHRVRLLIRADKTAPLQQAIRAWLRGVKQPNSVRLAIDIDPQSFL